MRAGGTVMTAIPNPQCRIDGTFWLTLGMALAVLAAPASAQDTRGAVLAAERADKATRLRDYEPSTAERRILSVKNALTAERPVYAFFGSAFDGGGFALGPGYRGRFGDSGTFDVHAG